MRNDGGYVTLAVLLMLAMLAALISGLLLVSRPALGISDIGADEVAADGLLEGGLNGAAFLLFGQQRTAQSVNGTTLRFRTGTARITVLDEAGRINLNYADEELLEGIYSAAGGSSLSATAFAGHVIDWRDEDDEVGGEGAEAPEYESAGSTHRPPNRPFRSVDELRLVLGLSSQDFARLEPLVTVHSHQGVIDPLSASPTVLYALPGATRPEVQRLLEARAAGATRDQFYEQFSQFADYFTSEASGVFRVGVQARLTSGYASAMQAVIVQPGPDERADYRVVAWSRLVAPVRPR